MAANFSVPKQLQKQMLDHSMLSAPTSCDAVVEAVKQRQRQDKQSYFRVAQLTLFPDPMPIPAGGNSEKSVRLL
eukprot:2660338-Rhodomonas_salina.2